MAVSIEAHELSKRYRIGQMQAAYGTLRDSLSQLAARVVGREETHEVEEIWALRDVSFAVREGEVLGVVGRNGAGKSTLLKILTRITTPTSGRAIIRGRVGSLLEVGTGFNPELTGRRCSPSGTPNSSSVASVAWRPSAELGAPSCSSPTTCRRSTSSATARSGWKTGA